VEGVKVLIVVDTPRQEDSGGIGSLQCHKEGIFKRSRHRHWEGGKTSLVRGWWAAGVINCAVHDGTFLDHLFRNNSGLFYRL